MTKLRMGLTLVFRDIHTGYPRTTLESAGDGSHDGTGEGKSHPSAKPYIEEEFRCPKR